MSETVGSRRDRSLDLSLKRTNLKVCPYILTAYCLLFLSGCASETNISNLYHYRFSLMYPPTGTLDFEDDALHFTFQPGKERIDIIIENKGTQTVEINWDDVEFEDRHNALHKVTASNINPEEKDKPGVTVILPGKRLETWIMPVDYTKRSIGRWKPRPLFPELKTGFDVDTWDRTTFKLLMPIKIGGEKKDYQFGFRVRID